MTMFLDNQAPDDAELVSSRIGRTESNEFENQPVITDTLFPENDDDDSDEAYTEKAELDDEPVDEEGDPTGMPDHGEHDHHQDDNYALGGHVTRSGS